MPLAEIHNKKAPVAGAFLYLKPTISLAAILFQFFFCPLLVFPNFLLFALLPFLQLFFALFGQLIPREHYPNAATWSSSAWMMGSVLGPALGGLVILLVGYAYVWKKGALGWD